MRLLWVATKPPWPPVDGGRLVLDLTLRALAAAGHAPVVIAPRAGSRPDAPPPGVEARIVEARPRPLPLAWLAGKLRGRPATVERHALAAVRREVAAAIRRERFELVVAEQVQALAAAEPAFDAGLGVVLRAQNVESRLWTAGAARFLGGRWLAGEARRLAAFEGQAVRRAAATVALTEEDARELARLAGRPVDAIPAPFPSSLEPSPLALPGSPALVVLASGGWRPNRDGLAWLLAEGWPALRRAFPAARLHVYGDETARGGGDGVVAHPAPAESRLAFASDALFVVPLFVASGVRMKILEAWARGVPVAATPAAASGLGGAGEALVTFDDAASLVAAVAAATQPSRRAALVAAGRRVLGDRHDPAKVAAAWSVLLDRVASRRPAR